MTKGVGPAFPRNAMVNSHGFQYQEAHSGMDLRDYFATAAMQGMLSHGSLAHAMKSFGGDSVKAMGSISEQSYNFADAMLKARGE